MKKEIKYLITGGSGKLGTELKKHLDGLYPTHIEFDITKVKKLPACDMLIQMASYTHVDKAEKEKVECFKINVFGTYNMLKFNKPFVFISSEHADSKGTYFESKLI